MKISIIGTGRRNCGDDGVAFRATEELKPFADGSTQVFYCSDSPQRYVSKIIGFSPEKIMIITALDMGESSGSVKVFDIENAYRKVTESRDTDFSMFLGYLMKSLECPVFVIAVQPRKKEYGKFISAEGRNAVTKIKALVRDTIGR